METRKYIEYYNLTYVKVSDGVMRVYIDPTREYVKSRLNYVNFLKYLGWRAYKRYIKHGNEPVQRIEVVHTPKLVQAYRGELSFWSNLYYTFKFEKFISLPITIRYKGKR